MKSKFILTCILCLCLLVAVAMALVYLTINGVRLPGGVISVLGLTVVAVVALVYFSTIKSNNESNEEQD